MEICKNTIKDMTKKKTMIYDHDEWLEPYKEVIDRRHEMIMGLKERMSVDGSLAKGMNNHSYYGLHRDAKGNWQVVHQINETAQALNEKGVDTKEAIKYAAVLDSLAQSDDLSASQVKRKLDVFSPAVREQVEEMTGRTLPEPTTKAESAREIKAAFDAYREERAEEERIQEEQEEIAAQAEEQAAIAAESDAEAAQFMEQAVAEQEQAVAQEQAQQAQQQQQAQEPQLVQPLETLEEFLARTPCGVTARGCLKTNARILLKRGSSLRERTASVLMTVLPSASQSLWRQWDRISARKRGTS